MVGSPVDKVRAVLDQGISEPSSASQASTAPPPSPEVITVPSSPEQAEATSSATGAIPKAPRVRVFRAKRAISDELKFQGLTVVSRLSSEHDREELESLEELLIKVKLNIFLGVKLNISIL